MRVYESEDIMAPVTESTAKAASEYTEPVLAAIEESMRDVRRAVVAGRHAVEDCTAETTLRIRQHPFASLGVAAGVGALFGCMIGFTVGRFGAGRPS